VDDIVKHLQGIALKEGITADEKALHIISQKADGALRDALSIFDQIVSFSNNHVSYQAVLDNLNVLDYDFYFKIIDFSLAQNIGGNLLIYNEILSKGFDGSQFILGLSEHLRNLLVCKDPSTVTLLEVPEEIKEKYLTQARGCSQDFLLLAWLPVRGAFGVASMLSWKCSNTVGYVAGAHCHYMHVVAPEATSCYIDQATCYSVVPPNVQGCW
jgi:DNA polymerase-3 subunit gamma/tau